MTAMVHPALLREDVLLVGIRHAIVGTKDIPEARRRVEAIFSPQPVKLEVSENPHSEQWPVLVVIQARKDTREWSLVCAR